MEQLIVFQAVNGAIELRQEVVVDTVWANLDQISLLFSRAKSVISRHIKSSII